LVKGWLKKGINRGDFTDPGQSAANITCFTLSLVVCPLWSAIEDKIPKTLPPKKSRSAAPNVRRCLLSRL